MDDATARIGAMASEAIDLPIGAVEKTRTESGDQPSSVAGQSPRERVESMLEAALRHPGGFGPAQPAPPDATPTARLMALPGRSVA
ncbi:hypothetical protein [Mycobacterium sp. Lab-001]|uniref:hypothetical protein n=1 Tax=Mycobacterium sp. Lab-001 TaxID=3410136 RepID=UPI003D182526